MNAEVTLIAGSIPEPTYYNPYPDYPGYKAIVDGQISTGNFSSSEALERAEILAEDRYHVVNGNEFSWDILDY